MYICITRYVITFSREDKLVERTKALKVNAGTEADADLGPVISKQVYAKSISCTNIFVPLILTKEGEQMDWPMTVTLVLELK